MISTALHDQYLLSLALSHNHSLLASPKTAYTHIHTHNSKVLAIYTVTMDTRSETSPFLSLSYSASIRSTTSSSSSRNSAVARKIATTRTTSFTHTRRGNFLWLDTILNSHVQTELQIPIYWFSPLSTGSLVPLLVLFFSSLFQLVLLSISSSVMDIQF